MDANTSSSIEADTVLATSLPLAGEEKSEVAIGIGSATSSFGVVPEQMPVDGSSAGFAIMINYTSHPVIGEMMDCMDQFGHDPGQPECSSARRGCCHFVVAHLMARYLFFERIQASQSAPH